MKTIVVLLAVAVALASGAAVAPKERGGQRIVGGSVTTIGNYPYSVAMLFGYSSTYTQACGGAILTRRIILTAAHCFFYEGVWDSVSWWRARVGSTYANSGGVVHVLNTYVPHSAYNTNTNNNDVSLARTSTDIVYNANTAAVSIAGSDYNLPDNTPVWAIGWGDIQTGGPASEQLRHVQVWTINQNTCAQRYGTSRITNAMLCSGYLNVGGRDQCQGDSGGPLMHNNVVIGVCSWGGPCADPYYPGVNARVSVLSNWISQTAAQLG